MPRSWRIGRIYGIAIEVNFSWFLVVALFTVSLAQGWFPQAYPAWSTTADWIVGAVSALLLFVSVLVHELAHSLVARLRGLPVSSITLFFFGGVSNLQQEPHSAGEEFVVAVVGPLTSLGIGVICWPLGQATAGVNSYLAGTLSYLGAANVLLGLFNLIPGFPLDGGRVLRSIIWRLTGSLRTATRWASSVGDVVAYLFILFGVWQVFNGNLLGGIWIGFIGWFLLNAAQAANTEVLLQTLLRDLSVAAVMATPPAAVSPNVSLQSAIDGYLLPRGQRAVPVVEGERFLGLLTVGAIRRFPPEAWPTIPVEQVMIPLAGLHIVTPAQGLGDALHLMAEHDVNQVPVVQDGRLVGLLARDAIMRVLAVRRELGQDTAQPSAGSRFGTKQGRG